MYNLEYKKNMISFWNWLNKKYSDESDILEMIKITTGFLPEKLLIGYMIDYCNDQNISYQVISHADIKQTYSYLKQKIDKIY